MSKRLGINQVLLIQGMQPCDTFFPALRSSAADNLLVIGNDDMPPLVRITIALAKGVEQNTGILSSVIHDTGHGDYVALNLKFCLQGSRIIAKCNQHCFEILNVLRYLQF